MLRRATFFVSIHLLFAASPGTAQIIFSNTDYRFTIHEGAHAVHLQVPTAEYTNWAYGTEGFSHRTAMTHRIYRHFQDLFDYVFIIDDEDISKAGVAGRHAPVKNNVSGLGKSIFDSTASYGSTGVLFSLILLTQKSGISSGPSLHEIAHRWANSLLSIPTQVSGHWGYSSGGGQLGGWAPGTLVDMGAGSYDADGPEGDSSWGSFANGGNGVPYSEIELYLMGLIPTNQVSFPMQIAEGFAWLDSAQGMFSATNIKTVSMADIVAIDGARTPAAGLSTTNFRGIAVILSDKAIDTARLESYHTDIEALDRAGSNGSSTYNFWEATGGRATLQLGGLLSSLKTGHEYLNVYGTGGFDAEGPEGGPFTSTGITYTISNSFGSAIIWTSTPDATWVSTVPEGGVLTPGSSTQVIFNLNNAANSLPGGLFTASVSFVSLNSTVSVLRSGTLRVLSYPGLPFYEDFESGTFPANWKNTGSAEFRTWISSNFFPRSGNLHMIMDDSVSGPVTSRNEATLGFNLTGYSNVILSFWAKDYYDESHSAGVTFTNGANFDGIAISTNGTNWRIIHFLNNLPDTNYTQISINLDAACASNGITYNNRFLVRFNHYDNFSINASPSSSDGLTFDDISVTGLPPVAVDSDLDGMPDDYESLVGLNPNNPGDAAEDPDDDGALSFEEYLADTHPTNGASTFHFRNAAYVSNGTMHITFSSSSNRSYHLRSSTNLAIGNWSFETSNIPGTGSDIQFIRSSNTTRQLYFRIETWKP